MGCKCANSGEEEEEIQKNALEDGNLPNEDNEFNKNFHQNENLLGLHDQVNIHQEDENIQNSLNDRNNLNLNQENYNNENNINNNNVNYDQYEKYSDYPQKIVELINNIREDPVGYSNINEDSIKNIIEEEDKDESNNKRLIYKKKLKLL